jgi:MFS family permease
MAVGLVMYKTQSFKWLGVAGAAIRLIGYGVMIRLRTNESSMAEQFIVQVVQGLGSGIIETIIVVGAQSIVPHAELAQVTSLISLSAFLGDGIGSAIAGGIYTDTLRERLQFRLNTTNQTEIDSMFNSITGTLPLWDTLERTAVNEAVSNAHLGIYSEVERL